MLKSIKPILAAILFLAIASPAFAAVEVGDPAPNFQATDIYGNEFNLNDHKGKIVVLEWTNHECPFVIKHYDTSNMQNTQSVAKEMGNIEWVSIVSSAPGKQGHTGADKAAQIVEEQGATVTTKILDESGEIGKMYDAKTTPHMFIIDEDGTLVYQGAIDDNSSPRHETVEGAKNYVLAALDDLKNDREVETPVSAPYGCSVKY